MKNTKVYKEEKDPYNAGPCPTCGKYANGTWRHIGAPVSCEDGHLWFRNTNVVATSSSDVLSNHK